MSTLVAVRKDDRVAIATDRQSNQGDLVVPGDMRVGPKKVHQVGGGYIGVVGSMAHHSVLTSLHKKHPELFNLGGVDEIFETLRSIHPLMREEYYLLTDEKDNDDQPYESTQLSGLVISDQGVFSFFGHREVSEYKQFWAAGSGTDFALGATESLYNVADDAKAIAEAAVAAACRFDSSSGPPIDSYDLALKAK